jgi:hypothetical protein
MEPAMQAGKTESWKSFLEAGEVRGADDGSMAAPSSRRAVGPLHQEPGAAQRKLETHSAPSTLIGKQQSTQPVCCACSSGL